MSDLNLTPQEQNIVDYHNGSMSSGRVGRDDQGRPITVYSTGIMIERGPHRGRFVSVPGWVPEVNPDRPLTEREAFEHWEDEINKGTWPFYGSGEELNNRSQEMHGIMDMDADIINQNMGPDGRQPIHVTREEADLVRRLEGGDRDPDAQRRYDYMRTLDYTYDPENPPEGMTDEERRRIYETDFQAGQSSDNGLDGWRWQDIRSLAPSTQRMDRPDILTARPMSTSGLVYVDDAGSPTVGMRGDRTPTHLQRTQDDMLSYRTAEMARAELESLRAELPRELADRMNGSTFVELGRDGLHSLFTGDNNTGFIELSYGSGDKGFRDAMTDARAAFGYAYDTGDVDIDGGFYGRAASANHFRGYSTAQVADAMRQYAFEATNYIDLDPALAAQAMQAADEAADELKRRDLRPEARTTRYSTRVGSRDARRRANTMMAQ